MHSEVGADQGRHIGRNALLALIVAVLMIPVGVLGVSTASAAGPCDPGSNPIVCENSKPGTPPQQWKVQGIGDPTIQGFATATSVNKGETVTFKVNSAAPYHYDILRLGYYQGNGARIIASNRAPSAPQPQAQPPCNVDSGLGLVDCGTWAVSASWQVPSDAISGVYIARLYRDDTGSDSQITFIVRDDSSHSDLVVQASDTTWQAYNDYGGYSLYVGDNAQGRAYKVSFNRPYFTATNDSRNWWTNAELQMWMWLEKNGYDVTYSSALDTDRRGALIRNHKVFISSGHDEYWSGDQRANVESALAAGVNLAFFTGNTMYWKTRYEASNDGTNTPYRTLVTYKESLAGAQIDPAGPATWTGLYRDTRFSPPGDGGDPENAIIGQQTTVICCSDTIKVPAADGKMRLWRNTSIANLTGDAVASLTQGTLGYEWESDVDNGSRPPGIVWNSSTTSTQPNVIKDFGQTTGVGTETHHVTMYKAPSGARVFSTGTVSWSWNLMGNPTGDGPNVAAEQATVNIFADMGVQPNSLQSDLSAATTSTDTTAPTSTITSPAAGTTLAQGSVVTVTGTASDTGGGVVGGVEISTDNGATWHPATGRSSWTYTWTVGGNGPVVIKTRAVDDSGNLETPNAGKNVTVNCPCKLFPTAVPINPSANDGGAVEVGVRFSAQANGYITGVRFYKGTGNTGAHVGNLWTNDGTLLARATFTNETDTGWQQVNFASPVAVTAGTTYVASYHTNTGHYAGDAKVFWSPVDLAPLHAPASSAAVPNGVYSYSANTTFPTSTIAATNYYVDVVFTSDATPPAVLSVTPASGATGVTPGTVATATFTKPVQAASVNMVLTAPNGATIPSSTAYNASTSTATLTPLASLDPNTTYTVTVSGVVDAAGNPMAGPYAWSFTTATFAPCPCTIWPATATPANPTANDGNSVELGVKFRSDAGGFVTGVRFYKGTGNDGVHTGSLWTASGSLLATGTFTNETATGWQQLNFSSWVPVSANTTYVVSYHAPKGRYSYTSNNLTNGVDNAPLHALASGVDGPNAVYVYSAGTTFPTSASAGTNYWVDPVFTNTNAGPAVTNTTPAANATGVPASASVTAGFGKSVQPSSVNIRLNDSGGNVVPSSSSYDSASRTVTLVPSSPLNASGVYTATVSGVVDTSGVPMAAPYTWSFTVASPATCPCTIWPASATPATAAASDTKAVELGVKFRADTAGYITGIRFYKGAGNTGTHTGSLWSASGTLLGTATFTNETATGWQQVNFSQPVLVSPNTTYVASYHTDVGRYSVTTGGLASAVPSAPLTALASGVDGPNAVYKYSTTSAFPNLSGSSANYWVDVVYGTAPQVVGRTPHPGATGVARTSVVTATFNQAVAPASIQFSLADSVGNPVTGAVTYDAASKTATFTPAGQLNASTQYRATVSGATDVNGVAMAAPYTWTFSTQQQPPVVVATAPTANGTASSVTAPVTATFNQTIDTTSLSFTVKDSGNQAVAGSATFDAATSTARFTPTNPFTPLSSYSATVSARNPAGDVMSPYTWSFTQPMAAPTVTSSSPESVESGPVPFNAVMKATFSQPVNPATIQFSVAAQGGGAIAGTVSYDNATTTATFTPNALLPAGTTFTASVSGAQNSTGVAMAAPYSWSFTTAAPQIIVTQTTPASGATEVALAAPIQATLSQVVVPSSVGFTLQNAAHAAVPGSVTVDAAGTTATFTPSAPLSPGVAYTASITGAQTADGKVMTNPYSWSFTASARPTISAQTPAANATGVAVTSAVTVTFAAPVTPGSVSVAVTAPQNAAVPGSLVLDPSQTVATFTPSAPLASTIVYTVTVSGAVSAGGAPMAAPVTWNFTTGAAPTVTAKTPDAGATGVAPGTTVTATFDQAVTPESIGITLTGPLGAMVAGAVAYDGATKKATFTPNAPLNAATTYQVVVSGAASSGGTMAPVSWSFTTVDYGCPCSVFLASATPATVNANDSQSVELGMRFKADVNGYVTGVRFYKGSANTGAHTGTVWANDGTQLATVTFSGETASGWQQADFSTPVAVTAGTTYVISYHANIGRYSFTGGAFANGGSANNGPLHGLTAVNGMYAYGTGPRFPANTSTTGVNYFVDVVFAPSAAPLVQSTDPAPGATGVPVGQAVSVSFNVPVSPNGLSFVLRNGSGATVPATVALDPTGRIATLTPSAPLDAGGGYSASVRASDQFGTQMPVAYGWSFAT